MEPSVASLRAAQGEVPTEIVLATKGGGKSSYFRWLVRSHPRTDFLILDGKGEFFVEDFGPSRVLEVRAPGQLHRLSRPGPGYVYLIRSYDGEGTCKVARAMGRCAVILDEGDQVIGKDRFVDRSSESYLLINNNRQPLVAVYIGVRRPADVWLTLESNSTHLVCGYVQQRRDLVSVSELSSEETAEMVRALPDPKSNPAGVYMVKCNLRGRIVPRRIFVPHKEAGPTH